jgi:protease-4
MSDYEPGLPQDKPNEPQELQDQQLKQSHAPDTPEQPAQSADSGNNDVQSESSYTPPPPGPSAYGGGQAYQGHPPYYAPPPSRNRWWLPVLGVGCGCLLLLSMVILPIVLIGAIAAAVSESGGTPGPKVALIHVDGVITSGSSGGGIFSDGMSGAETIVEQLEKARKDNTVKAVVLRIDSPGGTPAGSEEIYNEINKVKLSKPVYASMGDVAASGGYYIASACNRIYANQSTATGSIGVIMETPNLSGLFEKIGVDLEVVKSGRHKDIGNPARPMTPEERQLIQEMVDDTYDQFVTAVSKGRNMPKTKVVQLATGRIFTGRQAKEVGLIDEFGGLRDTILAAARAGGIKGEPQVAKYSKGGPLAQLLMESRSSKTLTPADYDRLADLIIRRLATREANLEGLR